MTCSKQTVIFELSPSLPSYKHNIKTHIVTVAHFYNKEWNQPEVVENISGQDVYEENGQADVEQDYHADHYGVWALGKKEAHVE